MKVTIRMAVSISSFLLSNRSSAENIYKIKGKLKAMSRREYNRREQLGREISGLMGQLVRTFRTGFVACADQHELGPGEAQVLWLLDESGDTSTGDLARRLDIDPANASTLLTKLERRRFVRRVSAEHDRRKRLISLTAEGRNVKLALARCIGERQPGFDQLTTSELVSFRDLLRRVAGRAESSA